MRRENYNILLDAEVIGVKHAWNSSIRFIEDYVLSLARQEGVEYNLVSKTSNKGMYGFTHGYRVWEGNGKTLTFEVSKQNLLELVYPKK